MIKVSVCVVCYNQEDYIEQCLQSLVNQTVNFDYEIIVADDCSVDNTCRIVQKYHSLYPKLIKPIFREKNTGFSENLKSAYNHACGEYIAHVDGDDYFLDGKLQAQADFLDNHPNYSAVFHRMKILNGDVMIDLDGYAITEEKKSFSLDDALMMMCVGLHSSKMFRASCHKKFIYPKFDIIDYYLNAAHAKEGLLGYLGNDKAYGVYRYNIGISSKQNRKILLAYYNSIKLLLHLFPAKRNQLSVAVLNNGLQSIRNKYYGLFLKHFYLLARCRCIPFVAFIRNRRCMKKMRIIS